MAFLLGSGVHSLDRTFRRPASMRSRLPLLDSVDVGIKGIRDALRDDRSRFVGGIRRAASSRAVLRGALAHYGADRIDEACDLVSQLASAQAFDDALEGVVNEHLDCLQRPGRRLRLGWHLAICRPRGTHPVETDISGSEVRAERSAILMWSVVSAANAAVTVRPSSPHSPRCWSTRDTSREVHTSMRRRGADIIRGVAMCAYQPFRARTGPSRSHDGIATSKNFPIVEYGVSLLTCSRRAARAKCSAHRLV